MVDSTNVAKAGKISSVSERLLRVKPKSKTIKH